MADALIRPANVHELQELELKRGRALTLADDWHRRLLIWLGVVNGAGLAGISSQVVEHGSSATWLLPSAWFFFFGVLAAGLSAWGWHAHTHNLGRMLDRHIDALKGSNSSNGTAIPRGHFKLAVGARLASAILFAGAVLLPLVGVSLLAVGIRLSPY